MDIYIYIFVEVKNRKAYNEISDPLKWELSMTIRQETHFILYNANCWLVAAGNLHVIESCTLYIYIYLCIYKYICMYI